MLTLLSFLVLGGIGYAIFLMIAGDIAGGAILLITIFVALSVYSPALPEDLERELEND